MPSQTSGGFPSGPRKSGSKGDGQLLSPGKRLSRDSGGSTGGVEEQMSLLDMFEEQKRQHLRQQLSGRGQPLPGGGAGGADHGHKGAGGSGHHLAHIQSGVILQNGGEN